MDINKFRVGDRVRPICIRHMDGTVRTIGRSFIGIELDKPTAAGHDLNGLLPPNSKTGWYGSPGLWEVICREQACDDAGISAPDLDSILS